MTVTSRRIRILVLGAVVAVMVVGLYPVSYMLCPEWEVLVLDASGNPVPGMTVRRTCENYSSGGRGAEDDIVTNDQGQASFDAKRARLPVLLRWAGNIVNVVSQGVHASFGRHAYVFAFGRGLEGTAVANGYVEDWTGEPEQMSSSIVVKPVEP